MQNYDQLTKSLVFPAVKADCQFHFYFDSYWLFMKFSFQLIGRLVNFNFSFRWHTIEKGFDNYSNDNSDDGGDDDDDDDHYNSTLCRVVCFSPVAFST